MDDSKLCDILVLIAIAIEAVPREVSGMGNP